MFAGKTTALINETIGLKPINYLVFKPSIDTRSKKNTICSHENKILKCIDVAEPMEILSHITPKTKNVFIDETQFMDSSIVELIEGVNDKGVQVTCAGLLFDSSQKHFGSMKLLHECAAHKIQLFASCNDCGTPAIITYFHGTKNSQIRIGGKDKYKALCGACFKKKELSLK
jgi:thymidine kinase